MRSVTSIWLDQGLPNSDTVMHGYIYLIVYRR